MNKDELAQLAGLDKTGAYDVTVPQNWADKINKLGLNVDFYVQHYPKSFVFGFPVNAAEAAIPRLTWALRLMDRVETLLSRYAVSDETPEDKDRVIRAIQESAAMSRILFDEEPNR